MPEIFNTDQGCQFTGAEFTEPLLAAGVKLSMDGKGRCLDTVFVERLWRSLKYEEVCPKRHEDVIEANRQIGDHLRFYNERRPHSAHGPNALESLSPIPNPTGRLTAAGSAGREPKAPSPHPFLLIYSWSPDPETITKKHCPTVQPTGSTSPKTDALTANVLRESSG